MTRTRQKTLLTKGLFLAAVYETKSEELRDLLLSKLQSQAADQKTSLDNRHKTLDAALAQLEHESRRVQRPLAAASTRTTVPVADGPNSAAAPAGEEQQQQRLGERYRDFDAKVDRFRDKTQKLWERRDAALKRADRAREELARAAGEGSDWGGLEDEYRRELQKLDAEALADHERCQKVSWDGPWLVSRSRVRP